jgi:tripartite-type tricarboxylate transporter receptor subunit TctC
MVSITVPGATQLADIAENEHTMKLSIRLLALAVASFLGGVGVAQTYPDKPIIVIVPFTAGGGSDLIARVLQPELAKSLGQQVLVVNRDGAAGTIGTAAVAQASPDGYVIGLIASAPLISQPHLRKLPYSLDSFEAVCQAFDGGPHILMVAQSSPFKSMAELIEYAKANPGKLTYGSSGPGSLPHLAMADFVKTAGVDIVHVPYKGSGGAAQALLGGHINLLAEQANVVASYGLRGLAVFDDTRYAALVDLPTMKELGIPTGSHVQFGSIVAPKGTPKAVLDKLEKACYDGVHAPAFRDSLQKQKMPFLYRGAADQGKYLRASSAKLAEVIKAADIKTSD